MPSSRAFLFFDEEEAASLLIRKSVFFVTEPVTFPPSASILSFSASRLAKCAILPVMTKVFHSSGRSCPVLCGSSGSITVRRSSMIFRFFSEAKKSAMPAAITSPMP